MDKLSMLTVQYDFGYGKSALYPAVLQSGLETVLVDCGYPGFLPLLEVAAANEGIDFSHLTKVVITHHDHDHMGSLAAIRQKYPAVKVVAGEKEAQYVSGKAKSLRLIQAQSLQPSLPEAEQAAGLAFMEAISAVQSVPVDIAVSEGDVLELCGGTEIVETPGHTPGHISLYARGFKTLIAGDALAVEDGKLVIPEPRYTLDPVEARRSVAKLLRYDIQRIICYHGGVYTENIPETLQRLAKVSTHTK